MLDVVLYGYNNRGLLTLQERVFASLLELTRFFSSLDSDRWQWAEVEVALGSEKPHFVRYRANELRDMALMPDQSSRIDRINLATAQARPALLLANSDDEPSRDDESDDFDSSSPISGRWTFDPETSTPFAEAWVSDYRGSGNAVILMQPSSATSRSVQR